MIRKGDKVAIMGFICRVVRAGDKCQDDGCDKATVTIIDPEGREDTVHEEDCDASDGR